MKVHWVSQENPTSAEDALEKSIAKWRFFSYCTKKQFSAHSFHLTSRCGLCHWVGVVCDHCMFSVDIATRGNQCPKAYKDAEAMSGDYMFGKATLAQFHAAARKVFAKLRSLRSKS